MLIRLGTIKSPTKEFQCSFLTTWHPPSHLHFPNSLELCKKSLSFILILSCYQQVVDIHQDQDEPSFGRQSKQGTFKSVFSSLKNKLSAVADRTTTKVPYAIQSSPCYEDRRCSVEATCNCFKESVSDMSKGA